MVLGWRICRLHCVTQLETDATECFRCSMAENRKPTNIWTPPTSSACYFRCLRCWPYHWELICQPPASQQDSTLRGDILLLDWDWGRRQPIHGRKVIRTVYSIGLQCILMYCLWIVSDHSLTFWKYCFWKFVSTRFMYMLTHSYSSAQAHGVLWGFWFKYQKIATSKGNYN